MAALFCLTLAQGTKAGDEAAAPKAADAQERAYQPKLSEQDVWRRWQLAHNSHATGSQTHPTEIASSKLNKASGIIGMNVRDQNHEHLGRIKDLVIDWNTDQVSYALISTRAKMRLATDEKLLAVPLTALTFSPDHKRLILNADKSKVVTASGFERNK
jgi:sporulation protein YlmC with PRC-barrel domain